MGIITKPITFVDNTVPTASQFNGDFDALYNEFNGNITNANISASAGISISKINAGVTGALVGTNDTQSLSNKTFTDTLSIAGGITQTGSADHITLTPGTSKLVKLSVLDQAVLTNTYRNNVVILTGFSFFTGDGASADLSKTITFGLTFTNIFQVKISRLGIKDGSDPVAVTELGAPSGIGNVAAGSITTTGFTAYQGLTVTTTNGRRYGFAWEAIGAI